MRIAAARPIPNAPPVMMATLPRNLFIGVPTMLWDRESSIELIARGDRKALIWAKKAPGLRRLNRFNAYWGWSVLDEQVVEECVRILAESLRRPR